MKNAIIILVGIIIALLIVGGAIAFTNMGSDNNQSDNTNNSVVEDAQDTVKNATFADDYSKSSSDDGVYVVTGTHVEKIFHQTDFNREASVMRFARQLRQIGVDQALRDLGVEDGDLVRILNFEFEFKD